MKLWKISQNENQGYDTYDSAVVVAETEEKARMVMPNSMPSEWAHDERDRDMVWCSPEFVTVEYIGEAAPGLASGSVVLASFNAG